MKKIILGIAILTAIFVGCSSVQTTEPTIANSNVLSSLTAATGIINSILDTATVGSTVVVPAGIYDESVILRNGVNLDLTGVVISYSGGGPAITDNGAPATCAVIGNAIILNPTLYIYDIYGNVVNCYDGAAVDIFSSNSDITLTCDSIIGDMRGVDTYGDLNLVATSVVGKKDCAVEIRPYAHAIITANLTAKGDSGYFGCNSGVGGVAIYAVNNNDTVTVNGDVVAYWDYTAKAGINSTIMINGSLSYFGPRTPTSGNVIISGATINLSIEDQPGNSDGHRNKFKK